MLLLLVVSLAVQLAASTSVASSAMGRTISFKPHDFETTVLVAGVEKKAVLHHIV